MFNEVYNAMGLVFVEDMGLFEKLWLLLKRLGVGLGICFLVPPLWLFKKLNKRKPLPCPVVKGSREAEDFREE